VSGLLLLDLLVNLPAFSAAAPLRSLLAPSIDLLVLVAASMAIAQAGPPARRPLRIGLAVLAAGLLAAAAGLRFGWDAGARLLGGPGLAMTAAAGWAVTVLIAAAAAVAAFLVSGLVVRGLEPRLVRSALLLVIALAAVLQAVSGRRVFTSSVIPRLISLIR
jgi:hypothetical protein